ncbi:hypothetical protein EV663_11668 [Rhodovulum bhavnagarense]|uniref:Uncharacterized protein n=1 Tax=Rhodovulum bhavnagarense TaxID=992286 RepID=A0A4R2R972_9RHOB|nr:hypothetical protein [Rhodovulum bhavnagarense]TCP59772.1 hypothetical protein EV663_11668 [Rhodovulum bhavnagarense]
MTGPIASAQGDAQSQAFEKTANALARLSAAYATWHACVINDQPVEDAADELGEAQWVYYLAYTDEMNLHAAAHPDPDA